MPNSYHPWGRRAEAWVIAVVLIAGGAVLGWLGATGRWPVAWPPRGLVRPSIG
ncbi:hypothetical protein QMN21_26750 [Serratia sp. Se-PFBMAAmG]|nr:hypothetical protein [Serratia sp. Se-PFBMAAmG]